MLKYRVQFKKYLETQKGFVLVDDVFEASSFTVEDTATLVLYDADGAPIHAFPPTFWTAIDIEPESSSLVL